jgi:FlaA1/EpsC-like NDP-sugar epimerase
VAGNSYSGRQETRFAVVRYGNVMGSRGSVIPLFLSLAHTGVLPITSDQMTRFMITLEQGVELVWHALGDMVGGEIYVRRIPSMKLVDIARAVAPDARLEHIGIRPGEKVHEQMIGVDDAHYTLEYPDYYRILPAIHEWSRDPLRTTGGRPVPPGFSYASDTNADWMTVDALRTWIAQNRHSIGQH